MEFTVYENLRLVRLDEGLYKPARRFFSHPIMSIIHEVSYGLVAEMDDGYYLTLYWENSKKFGYRFSFCSTFLQTPNLLIIQRQALLWLGRLRRRRARNLAIGMGLHPRLGAQSPLRTLDSELLRMIIQ